MSNGMAQIAHALRREEEQEEFGTGKQAPKFAVSEVQPEVKLFGALPLVSTSGNTLIRVAPTLLLQVDSKIKSINGVNVPHSTAKLMPELLRVSSSTDTDLIRSF